MRGIWRAALAVFFGFGAMGCADQLGDDGAPGQVTAAISVEQPTDATGGDAWTGDAAEEPGAATDPAGGQDTDDGTAGGGSEDPGASAGGGSEDPGTGADGGGAEDPGTGSGDGGSEDPGATDDPGAGEGDGGSAGEDEGVKGDDDEAEDGDDDWTEPDDDDAGEPDDDDAGEPDDDDEVCEEDDEVCEVDDEDGGERPAFDFAECGPRPGKATVTRNFGRCVSCCQRLCAGHPPCASTCAKEVCRPFKTRPDHQAKPRHPAHPAHPKH